MDEMEVTVIEEVLGFFLVMALSVTAMGFMMALVFVVEEVVTKIKRDKK